MQESNIVVAHAGTGTIIKALEFAKPIVVMARISSYGETRNDHQLHTVELFRERGYIKSFDDITGLDKVLQGEIDHQQRSISRFASSELLETVSSFIQTVGS
jgi:UDP-N-acetylglucosamine transferase subunit ALG13